MDFFNTFESYFELIVRYLIIIIEAIGIAVLIFSIIKAFFGVIRKKEKIRLHLAEGIALAIEFKMGGELLRTVIVRDWKELAVLGAVILIRAAMSFVIHWEIRNEKE